MSYRIVATTSPDDGRSAERLISNLYNTAFRVKNMRTHNHRIQWFDHESYRIAERKYILENDLKHLISGDYHLLIQPKINLADETIHGGEFLSRWIHPQLGLISPMEFIPLLEDNDLMADFTTAISEEIIKCCHSQLTPRKDLILAVNVNASSLFKEAFIIKIISYAKRISPFQLEIELTEDVFMQLDSTLKSHLDLFKKNGIRLAHTFT